MIYHQAKDPTAYQTIFYRQIGLKKQEEETGNSWRDDEGGYIYTFGTMDTIQMGIGEYTVPVDFLSEFQYDTEYLHAGIIYEGITYSLVDNHMKEFATPSAFLAMEQAAGGINCWKKGQHFKGVEISVELGYLRETLLPFLGLSAEALDFLEKNVRYLHLPEELQDLIFRAEQLLRKQEMTESLLKSLAAEFVSQLVRPEIRSVFANGEAMLTGKIKVGKKEIRMKKDDFQKIMQVHDRIRDHAETFVTIYACGGTPGDHRDGRNALYREGNYDGEGRFEGERGRGGSHHRFQPRRESAGSVPSDGGGTGRDCNGCKRFHEDSGGWRNPLRS